MNSQRSQYRPTTSGCKNIPPTQRRVHIFDDYDDDTTDNTFADNRSQLSVEWQSAYVSSTNRCSIATSQTQADSAYLSTPSTMRRAAPKRPPILIDDDEPIAPAKRSKDSEQKLRLDSLEKKLDLLLDRANTVDKKMDGLNDTSLAALHTQNPVSRRESPVTCRLCENQLPVVIIQSEAVQQQANEPNDPQ